MLLNLTDLSAEPLQQQIVRQMRAQILAGHLQADEPLPSIRGLAQEQRVSVTTIQRAYEELERDGLIRSRRGKGFFVAALAAANRIELAAGRAREALALVVRESLAEGLTGKRLQALFTEMLAAEGDDR